MADPFSTTEEVQRLIMFYEGFSSEPYSDYSQFSIGFGSGIDLDGNPVTATTPPINKRQGETLFTDVTLPIYEVGVANVMTRNDLPVEAMSALVCFAYNLGVSALEGSTLRKRIENSTWNDLAYQWSRWVNVTPANATVTRALCQRRCHEFEIFRDAVVAAGIATPGQFDFTLTRADQQQPFNPRGVVDGIPYRSSLINGSGATVFNYEGFRNFCTISQRRGDTNVNRSPWNQNPVRDPETFEIIGYNPGPFFPNGTSGGPAGAADTSSEAAEQGVPVVAIGNDPRRLQPPLVAAGMPVATILTPAGNHPTPQARQPAAPGNPTVLINGQPANVTEDTRPTYPVGSSTAIPTNVSGNPTVLVGGKPLALLLSLTNDGPGGPGVVGPGGSPTVITGI